MRPPLRLLTTVLLTTVLLLGLASPAQAQDAVAMEGTLPDSIVVTASRLAEEARQTGRRITVWTVRDIEALAVSSFDELLRTVGGVEAQSRGGFGIQSDLTMRGSSFNGVLLLLDGARMNDPHTNHFITDFPVPLAEIARIEVLRGPASAMYGPDALGGVIHIMTYTALRQQGRSPTDLEHDLQIRLGEDSLYDIDAALRHTSESTALSAAAALQGTEGQPIRLNGTVVRNGDGEAIRTDFTRQAFTLALAQDFGGPTVFARAGLDDRNFGAFHFYTPFPSDTSREATRTYWAQVRVQSDAGVATPWQVHLSAKQHDDTFTFFPGLTPNEHTSRMLRAQASLTRSLRPSLRVTAGATGGVRAIESNNLGDHDDGDAGAFVTARWQATAQLTLNGSGRLDYDPGFGTEATPHLSLAYNQGPFTLRAGVGRAVRAPSYTERYINTVSPRPGGNLGHPDLEAERAWAYEAGVDLYPTANLALHGTVFYRDTQNLIDYARVDAAEPYFLARNILDVQTTGIELDADATLPLGTSRLRVVGTYAWLDNALGDVADGTEFKYALINARHNLQGKAWLYVGALTLGLNGLWKERLTGETFGVVHARAAYRLSLGDQRFVLSGEVRNLLDAAYAEVFDAPMPGRWLLFGVRWAR